MLYTYVTFSEPYIGSQGLGNKNIFHQNHLFLLIEFNDTHTHIKFQNVLIFFCYRKFVVISLDLA